MDNNTKELVVTGISTGSTGALTAPGTSVDIQEIV